MNKPFLPNADYLLINLAELEEAWRHFARPSQAVLIGECLDILKTLSRVKSSKETVRTLVMMTGYLTSDDGASSQGG